MSQHVNEQPNRIASKLSFTILSAICVAAVFPGRSSAQSSVEGGLLPVNYITLGDVALVEDIPDSFYPDQPNTRDGRWLPERWSCLLRRKMHPTLINDIIQSYETNGLKDPPVGFSYDDSKFLKTFFNDCFPWGMKKSWEMNKATEFEKVRGQRQFFDQHRAGIEKNYDVKLPIRIGAIHEIKLDTYDRANEQFKITRQPSSSFVTGPQYPLRYRSDEPREFLQALPMPADEAEAFLGKLKDRRLHLMESHLLTRLEAHPDVTSGVVGVLSRQELSVFIPGAYETAVYVQKTKRVDEISQAAPKANSQPATGTYVANDDVAKKMQALCRELQLFNIDGIPVSGGLASGVLNSAQQDIFNKGQQRLADRLLLSHMSDLLSAEVETRRSRTRRDFALLTRVLGESTMARYYDERTSLWIGADVFAQRDSLQRFLREQGPAINKLAIKPPLRFRSLEQVVVEEYDFDNQRFLIRWPSDGINYKFGLRFPQSRNNGDFEDINVASPIVFPSFWNIDPNRGRQLFQALQTVSQDVRVAYASTVFDLRDLPEATPVYIGSEGRQPKQTGVLTKPISTALYLDGMCSKKIWDVPHSVPETSLLETGKPVLRDEELYLWQPEIQIALLDASHPKAVKRADLVVAATSVFQDDADYYRFGSFLNHRHEGLERRNIQGEQFRSDREEGWANFWDRKYQPFFPASFFGSRPLEFFGDAASRIRDSQLQILRNWLQQRLKQASGEFRMDCYIEVDRDKNQATLLPGSSSNQTSALVSKMPDADQLGYIARLTMPRDSDRRRFDTDDTATEFSVVFPAMINHLQFAVDVSSLPAFDTKHDDERYVGDLVVRIEKVETLSDGRQALVHIQPVRFEAVGSQNQVDTQELRLQKSGKTEFQLPVEIPRFTEADRKRQNEQKQREVIAMQEQKRLEEIEQEKARQRQQLLYEEEEQQRMQQQAEGREKARQDAELKAERDAEIERRRMEQQQAADQVRFAEMERQANREREEADRISQAESKRINDQANQLMADGYEYDDINWSTGEPNPNATPKSSGWFGWFIKSLLMYGAVALVGWRFWTGSLESDIANLRKTLLNISERFKRS